MRTGLTVIAYITAKAGHQQQVREALLDLVAQTRNERGCVNYDLHQSQENATEFAIYENWDKASDLDLHMLNRLMFKSSPELRATCWDVQRRSENGSWFQNSKARTSNA